MELQRAETVLGSAVDSHHFFSFPPDPETQALVDAHNSILKELDSSRLFKLEDWLGKNPDNKLFSTAGNRFGYSNGTVALCSMMRMAVRAQIGLINSRKYLMQQRGPSRKGVVHLERFEDRDCIPYRARSDRNPWSSH